MHGILPRNKQAQVQIFPQYTLHVHPKFSINSLSFDSDSNKGKKKRETEKEKGRERESHRVMEGSTEMKNSLPPSSYTSFPLKKYAPFPVMEDNSEICISDAHNYSNQHDQQPVAPLAASPVSSEEAWNGRTGHLGGIASKKRNVSGWKWKWFFGILCGGKKAVEIKEKVSEPKRQTKRLTVNYPMHKVSQKSVKGLKSRDWAKRLRTSPKFPPTKQNFHSRFSTDLLRT